MKKTLLGFGAAVAFTAYPAQAAQFLFTFSGQNLFGSSTISGNGIFTVSDTAQVINGQEAFKITDISGSLNSSPITALVPGVFGADNFFYKTNFFVRGQGIGFRNAAGTTANLFLQQGSRYRVNTLNPFGSAFVAASVTPAVAAVPEPSTWIMLLTGFLAIGVALRARKPRLQLAYR